jgi:drug/metabolite transporter (DMT)-like permease
MIQPDTTQRLGGYLMGITAYTLFGVNGTLSRLLLDRGVSPVTLAEFRMLIGCTSLFTVLVMGQRRLLKFSSRHWVWIVPFGLSLALLIYFYSVAIGLLPLAVVLVIQFSAAAWMTLGKALWERHWPPAPVLAALACTFSGVLLMTGVWQQSFNGLNSVGLLYASLTMLTYIANLLLGNRVGKELPALSSTTYGALVASLFWLVVQPPWSIPASTWQPQRLPLIILVGVVGMALPYALVLASLRRIEAARVGMVSTFEIVAASVIAYFWLGQYLTIWQIMGCLLVLIGVIILQYEKPVSLATH